MVLTGHHSDDLAETVLWRILTGQADTHGGGIAFQHGFEIRPLLTIRKKELIQYLKEEGQNWRVDETNFEGRFLRSRIRLEILPVLENVFPRAIEHLAQLGLDAQAKSPHLILTPQKMPALNLADSAEEEVIFAPELLLGAAGIRSRRAHWKMIGSKFEKLSDWYGALDLPGGWRLTREHKRKNRNSSSHRGRLEGQETAFERWVLEKS